MTCPMTCPLKHRVKRPTARALRGRLPRTAAALLGAALATGATACPTDATPRAAGTLLVVQGPDDAPRPFDAAALAALPAATLVQKHSVSGGSGGPATERSVAWSGVLLKDTLTAAGLFGPNDRGGRGLLVEAVATDGYRAYFSWGELFNQPAGDQVIVISAQDGRALDNAAGPLALRALADLRPGPRHVRNLCALRVRPAAR